MKLEEVFTRRRLSYVALALAVVGVGLWLRSRRIDDRADLHARALAVYDRTNAERRAALADAMKGAVVARPDLGPCTVDTSRAPTLFVTDARELDERTAILARRDVPWPDDIHLLSSFERTLGNWRIEIDIVSREALDRVRAGAHAPPAAAAQAYLYDWRAGHIVCAADLPRRATDAGPELGAPDGASITLFVAGPPR